MTSDRPVVWKYPLDWATTLLMPKGATILTVQPQGGTPHLWALVDPTAETEPREFIIVGTGHALLGHRESYTYLGTVQNGPLVWHAFEFRGAPDAG